MPFINLSYSGSSWIPRLSYTLLVFTFLFLIGIIHGQNNVNMEQSINSLVSWFLILLGVGLTFARQRYTLLDKAGFFGLGTLLELIICVPAIILLGANYGASRIKENKKAFDSTHLNIFTGLVGLLIVVVIAASLFPSSKLKFRYR